MDSVLRGSRRRGGGCRVARGVVARSRAGRRPLLRSHVWRNRRLSSLLLSPLVPDNARRAAFPRAPRDVELAEGGALVGRAPPYASQVLGPGRGRPLGAPRRLFVVAPRLDPVDQARGDRRGAGA